MIRIFIRHSKMNGVIISMSKVKVFKEYLDQFSYRTKMRPTLNN